MGESKIDESKIVGFSIAPEYSKFIYELTNPEKVSEKPEALDGVVVLDMSYGSYAGLFASSISLSWGQRS
jgi:hypothetical protein